MESINPHQERKIEIIESLTVRIKATRELLKKAEELSALTSEKAIEAIDKLLIELPSLFPEKVREKRMLLAALQAESANLSTEMDVAFNFDSNDFDISDFEFGSETEIKLEHINARIQRLMEEPDIMYLETIEAGLKHLRRKAEIVNYNGTQRQPSDPRTIRTDTDAFSVVAIIKESEWTKNKSYGFQVQNTPNIYIRESVFKNTDKYSETLAHERVHNVLDGIQTHTPEHPAKSITNRLKRIARLIELRAPETIIEQELAALARPRYLDHLLDYVHNELLAYWDSHENTALDNMPGEELLFAIFEGPENLPDFTISQLSTAGNQLRETISALEKLPAELSKSGHHETATRLENLHKDFKRKIIKMIHLTRKQSQKVKSLGPDAQADRRALMYLLRPSKYRHIDTYLDATYDTIPENDD